MFFCIGTGVAFSIGYYYFDDIKHNTVNFLLKKTREVVKHELKQTHNIEIASNRLKQLTIDHVMKNPKVISITGGLVEELLRQDNTKRLSKEMMVKAISSKHFVRKLNAMVDYKFEIKQFNTKILKIRLQEKPPVPKKNKDDY